MYVLLEIYLIKGILHTVVSELRVLPREDISFSPSYLTGTPLPYKNILK